MITGAINRGLKGGEEREETLKFRPFREKGYKQQSPRGGGTRALKGGGAIPKKKET